MTFAQFEKTLKQHAPRVIYCYKHSENRVEICFAGDPKIYRYTGAYIDILRKIGVNAYTIDELQEVKNELQRAEKQHGKPGLFVKSVDNTAEIDELRTLLEKMERAIIL